MNFEYSSGAPVPVAEGMFQISVYVHFYVKNGHMFKNVRKAEQIVKHLFSFEMENYID